MGRMLRAYFAAPLPRVIAHRGLASAAQNGHPAVVENTIAAFRAAREAGATHLETDVQVTRDGVVIVLHDADLGRVLGVTGPPEPVDGLTLAAVRERVQGRFEVATLEEALTALPDARFNIDVKAAGAVAGTAEAVRRAAAQDRVLIASFGDRRRRAAVRAIGDVATSASALPLAAAVIANTLRIPLVARVLLRGADAVQIPERVLGLRTTTPRMITAFHRVGVEVHVWTINAPADMARLLDAGVDGIVTDRCDLMVDLLRERAADLPAG